MSKCPNCGTENASGDSFCKRCGTKLVVPTQGQTLAQPTTSVQPQAMTGSPMEDEIKSSVIRRLDGIKNRDEGAIRSLIDESYNKFDDWPPFGRQEATVALNNEFGAYKVLSNYGYEVKDFQANVLGDVAVATFTLHYQGAMRGNPFDVTSRVTSILKKQSSGWKFVHEHFSRFPEERSQQFMQRRRGFRF